MTYDYNTAFDLALLDAYRAALRLGTQPRTTPEAEITPEPPKRNHNKKPGSPARTYKSVYVGVTTHHGLYAASWRDKEKKWRVGTDRPFTPEGEVQAARDYARVMGRDYLERRDGTREPLREAA